MCSLVSVYLQSRAKMRTVFIYVSTLSPLSCFIDLNLNLAILKLLFGATYFSNRSQYTDNVFYSMSDKSQVLETSMPSSPDHKSKYFTLKASVFSARGPSNMSWHIVLNFLNACGTSVDTQFIVGADNPAISAMMRHRTLLDDSCMISRGRGLAYTFWLALYLCLLECSMTMYVLSSKQKSSYLVS